MDYQLLRWEINGQSVIIETDESIGGWTSASSMGERVVHDVRVRFEDALSSVRQAAQIALRTFRETSVDIERPDEIELEFGVKFGTEAGAVIAKTALEGQFTVKLKWAADSPHISN